MFDWDRGNVEHVSRHEVRPEEVEQVFANDPVDVTYENVDGEPRWSVVGHTENFPVLLVVWTIRGEAVRPITAREVNRIARESYFRTKGFVR
jgi:uncharacterized DUF497 family protein